MKPQWTFTHSFVFIFLTFQCPLLMNIVVARNPPLGVINTYPMILSYLPADGRTLRVPLISLDPSDELSIIFPPSPSCLWAGNATRSISIGNEGCRMYFIRSPNRFRFREVSVDTSNPVVVSFNQTHGNIIPIKSPPRILDSVDVCPPVFLPIRKILIFTLWEVTDGSVVDCDIQFSLKGNWSWPDDYEVFGGEPQHHERRKGLIVAVVSVLILISATMAAFGLYQFYASWKNIYIKGTKQPEHEKNGMIESAVDKREKTAIDSLNNS